MNYTGHCVDKYLGRPTTAPALKTLGRGEVDVAKRTWDRVRFGEETKSFKGVAQWHLMTSSIEYSWAWSLTFVCLFRLSGILPFM
jgi:hypothetical protein